jgi:two-component system, cell cycle sensor histidine kinase and response regulator CckA
MVGLKIFVAGRVKAVILDVVMPEMSGGEIFEHIKSIDLQTPILLTSGFNIIGQARGILTRGSQGFIEKPFSLESLSKKLEEVILHP